MLKFNGTQITQMGMINTDNYKRTEIKCKVFSNFKILFNHNNQCHQRSIIAVEQKTI